MTIRRMACVLAVAIMIAACGGGGKGVVRIATKPMTEQFILGEMLALLIRHHAGLEVELTKGIAGGTGNIHPAVVQGKFDLYPEYTGTAWSYVLKRTDRPEAKELYAQLEQAYGKEFGLRWTGLYGFNNTYSLALRNELAERDGIKTFSQLGNIAPELIFGAEYDFYERDDGLAALEKTYGFKFKKTVDMDIGLKYQAIAADNVDVMVVFTTDGKLASAPVRVLEDDRGVFPTYYCGTVVREDALKRFSGLEKALKLMDGILDDATMARLNNEVEGKGRNERQVAEEFLKSKKLLP